MATKQITQKDAIDPSILSRPENRLAQRDWVPIWYIKEIMLVPHYTRKHMWVYPGGDVYDAGELVAMGAKQSTTLLWPRFWTQLGEPQ